MGRAVKSTKRLRRDPAEAKLLILKTAQEIMLEEGYAAVTVRRVAKSAGVSSTLLHYYYATADDLLVALYRNASEKDLHSLQSALSADDPVSALWTYQTDATRTALGVEFLALANHRKTIRNEIVQFAEKARALQAKALAALLPSSGIDSVPCSPLCISVLLTSISRNLIFESGVGISSGHAEARAYVERKLTALQRKGKRKR
jgi:TetR/AcrR family transcriptional regulator, regulator of autoinduction and epiphytic fitness